jgi:hypothetical protein
LGYVKRRRRVAEARKIEELLDELRRLGMSEEDIRFVTEEGGRRAAEARQREHVLDVSEDDPIVRLERRIGELDEKVTAILRKLDIKDFE